jgi:hypothetical protein
MISKLTAIGSYNYEEQKALLSSICSIKLDIQKLEEQNLLAINKIETLQLSNEHLCVVCLENQKEVLLIPCQHKAICLSCRRKIEKTTNKCPICRTEVIFYSDKVY